MEIDVNEELAKAAAVEPWDLRLQINGRWFAARQMTGIDFDAVAALNDPAVPNAMTYKVIGALFEDPQPDLKPLPLDQLAFCVAVVARYTIERATRICAAVVRPQAKGEGNEAEAPNHGH